MRKLKRSVARANMVKRGVRRINKDYGSGSFFSKYWRDYIK